MTGNPPWQHILGSTLFRVTLLMHLNVCSECEKKMAEITLHVKESSEKNE